MVHGSNYITVKHDLPGTNPCMLLRGKKIVSDQMIKNMISNNGFQNLTNNRSQCNWLIIVRTTTTTFLVT